jgi:hypothetical protein
MKNGPKSDQKVMPKRPFGVELSIPLGVLISFFWPSIWLSIWQMIPLYPLNINCKDYQIHVGTSKLQAMVYKAKNKDEITSSSIKNT